MVAVVVDTVEEVITAEVAVEDGVEPGILVTTTGAVPDRIIGEEARGPTTIPRTTPILG